MNAMPRFLTQGLWGLLHLSRILHVQTSNRMKWADRVSGQRFIFQLVACHLG